MFQKVLGYHAQIKVAAFRCPEGLKGSYEKYQLLRNGKQEEIFMVPVGRKIYTCPLALDWEQTPDLVVHRGYDAISKWQVDESVTGVTIVSGHDTRDLAVANAVMEAQKAGETAFWEAQKAIVKACNAANVPLNNIEIVQ